MKYPLLKPLPIETKGLSFFKRLKVWIFSCRKWEVMEDWTYDYPLIGADGDRYKIFIEKGFVFDGASVPRALWWLLNPVGILFIAGLIHDYAYRHQYLKIKDTKTGNIFTKYNENQSFWDGVFKKAAIQVSGCEILSTSAWSALRAFGFFAWKKNRKEQAKRNEQEWKQLKEFCEKNGII